MMSTLIATSISPDNIENQRNAVTSWLKLGYHVVSVNSQEEINVLQKDFRDIGFERVTRTGAAITGKPLIFLDDILTMLSRDGGDIVGIINSDIILDAPSNFQKMTIAHAKNGLIFGPRIEVNSVA